MAYRVEFKSTNCKLDNPTAAIVPNITQYTPPTMGWGIVRKMALNLQTIPIKIMKTAPRKSDYFTKVEYFTYDKMCLFSCLKIPLTIMIPDILEIL